MINKKIAVIGAGVIGLAAAYKLSQAGHAITVFEKEAAPAQHISGHNSGIIHAGLYYKPGSLKARFCIEGRSMIYDFCAAHNVRTKKIGKLIVATHEAQMEKLNWVYQNAQAIGATEVKLLNANEVAQLEPGVEAIAAILSPETGIFDVKAFSAVLISEIEKAGGEIIYNQKIDKIANSEKKYIIENKKFDAIVNAAGLWAVDVARKIQGLDQSQIPEYYFAKGNYFRLAVPTPFNHLVYPLPMPGGLGIHVSFDFSGTARFGPDVQWLDELKEEPDYTVDESRRENFRAAIATYYPAIKDMQLEPDYAGIRPKLVPADEPDADFIIQDCAELGLRNLINLYGFESPGLTGCLAIGQYLTQLINC